MKKIYFDEAGFSGNNLLDNNQPLFCYLGFEDKNNSSLDTYRHIKHEYGYSIDLEVKGSSLSKSTKGQNFLIALWNAFGSSCKFVLHEKKFALACKMFEYVYEPVFANVNILFYQINFHKYIATSMYELFTKNNQDAEQIFNNFYAFIKNKGDKSLEMYIKSCNLVKTSPFYYFYLFCENNKDTIASDIDFTDKNDKYILDLTLTSLYNLLGVFSNGSTEPMEVHCDNSKPLANDDSFWTGFVGNTNIVYDPVFGSGAQLTYNLSSKPILEDSREVYQLQIADFLASSVYQAYLHPNTKFSKEIKKISLNSYVKNFSIAPIKLQMAFDKQEIKVFNEIIKLLASTVSKSQKINKLQNKSYKLRHYQEIRDMVVAEYIQNYKFIDYSRKLK